MPAQKLKQSRHDFDRRSRLAGRILLILAFIISLIMSLALHVRFSFWLELAATYNPQLNILVIAFFLLFITTVIHASTNNGWRMLLKVDIKKWLLLVLSIGLLLHNLLLPLNIDTIKLSREADSTADTLRVMTFNKLYDNDQYQQIYNHINSRKPDVLALQEIFHDEARQLAEDTGYSHWHVVGCDCSAYGTDLALFSKFPLHNVELAFEGTLGGVLRGEVELAVDQRLVFYVTHIIVPYSTSAYQVRQNMLERLAEAVNGETDPVVVAGDFNTSSYAPDLRQFNSRSQDIDILGDDSWPQCSWYGLGELFCARIDHLFLPSSSVITNQQIGPSLGSDHRPVEVDFYLNNSKI